MTYFTLAGVPIDVITPSAEMDYQLRVSVDSYVAIYGSNTTHLGGDGKSLKLTIVVRPPDDIEIIRTLAWNKAVVPLVSPGSGGYNVLWRIESFKQKDKSKPDRPNRFEFNIELQEHVTLNNISQNFANWKVDKSNAKTKCPKLTYATDKKGKVLGRVGQAVVVNGDIKTLGTGSQLQQVLDCVNDTSTLTSQLKNCIPLAKNSTKKDCVTNLQKALRNKGYYIKYNGHNLVIDGIFGQYTELELTRFQKDNKLKKTGVLDKETLAKL